MFKDPFAGAQVPGRVRVKDRPDAAQGCKKRYRRDHAKQKQPLGAARRCRSLLAGLDSVMGTQSRMAGIDRGVYLVALCSLPWAEDDDSSCRWPASR